MKHGRIWKWASITLLSSAITLWAGWDIFSRFWERLLTAPWRDVLFNVGVFAMVYAILSTIEAWRDRR